MHSALLPRGRTWVAAVVGLVGLAAVWVDAGEPPFAGYIRDKTAFEWTARPDGRQLTVVSQDWHGAVWTHTVNIVPGTNSGDLCVLFVGEADGLGDVFRATGVSCASVGGMYPACHGQAGGEGIGTYSLQQAARTGDATWAISAATTKALVRVMDALGAHGKYRRIILTGFSKMGLACWWAAVMDERVVGLIPIGIDVLNIRDEPTLRKRLGDVPLEWVDPYEYRERLRASVLIIAGTNDEHFDIGSVARYWDGLPEPKWLLHLPNATHAQESGSPRAVAASIAFVRALASGQKLPKIESRPRIASFPEAKTVRAWTAPAKPEMKFAKWSAEPFTGDLKLPGFVEFEFDGYSLTTGIQR